MWTRTAQGTCRAWIRRTASLREQCAQESRVHCGKEVPAHRENLLDTQRCPAKGRAALGSRGLSVPGGIQAETWQLLTGHSLEGSPGSGTNEPYNLGGPLGPEFMGFCCDSLEPCLKQHVLLSLKCFTGTSS